MPDPTLLDLLLGRAEATGAEASQLSSCLDSPPWVEAVLAGAPYPDVESLLERADAAARALSPDAVLAALATHPRIGEQARGDDASARMSRLEQSGVAADLATLTRLAAANAAYEERFGHVFLIRAAGLTRDEVLDALERRMGLDPAVELSVAADQLRQIALLRLEATLAGGVGDVPEEPRPALDELSGGAGSEGARAS